MENRITQEDLQRFAACLRQEEKSEGTVEKYLRDAAGFAAGMGNMPVTKEAVAAWQDKIIVSG